MRPAVCYLVRPLQQRFGSIYVLRDTHVLIDRTSISLYVSLSPRLFVALPSSASLPPESECVLCCLRGCSSKHQKDVWVWQRSYSKEFPPKSQTEIKEKKNMHMLWLGLTNLIKWKHISVIWWMANSEITCFSCTLYILLHFKLSVLPDAHNWHPLHSSAQTEVTWRPIGALFQQHPAVSYI